MTELLHNPKIKPEHLARKAIVYLRQSSDKQVRQNKESQLLSTARAHLPKGRQRLTVLLAAQQNVSIRRAICNVQGTCVSSHAPRTDPYVRLSRIRLPPQVSDGRAIARHLPYAFQRL